MPDQVTVKKHNDANKLGYFISVTRKGAYSVPWAPMIVGKRVSLYPGVEAKWFTLIVRICISAWRGRTGSDLTLQLSSSTFGNDELVRFI